MRTDRTRDCFAPARSIAWAAVLAPLCAVCISASAQNPDANTGKGTVKDGYLIQQSFELGGHIATRSGSRAMYNSLVNMESGPRILDATLTAHATAKAKHPWFDDLFTTNTGYGGDPQNFTVLRASKAKLYEFNGMFRRNRQYFDYDLLDNPLVPAGISSNGYTFPQVADSPHLFNTVRRMTDADLTLLPLAKVSFHVGYSQNLMQGPTLSSYHQGADALLFQYWRNSTDAWRGGVDWKLHPKTTLSFYEVIVHYKGNTNWQLTGLNLQLGNGTPVSLGFDNTAVPSCGNHLSPIVSSTTTPPTANATCNGFLQYTRSAPMRTLFPTEEFHFQSSDIKNIQMNGNVRYTSANTNLPLYQEFFNGFESRTSTRAITVTGNGKARRLNINAGYGIVWQIAPRLSLSEQVDYENWRIPSANNLLETTYSGTSMLNAPAAAGTASTTTDAIFLGEKITRNTLIARWQATPRTAVSLGYLYTKRHILRRDVNGTDDFPISQNGGILGVDLAPTPQWKVYGNVEIAYADNTYLQLKPRHFQHYQLRSIYRHKSWATVSGSFDDLERRNDVLYVNHFDHVRSGTISLEAIASSHFNLNASYGYLDFFTQTDECYAANPAPLNAIPAPPPCVDNGTPYLTNGYYNSPTQNGSFGFNVSAMKRLKAGMGYQITAIDGTTKAINPRQVPGSSQSTFQAPYAHVMWTLSEGWGLLGNWNYYGYGEGAPPGPTLPRIFHGNIYTLGVHYEF
ncbi:MAG TPA: hypothetical protein VGR47_15025 [Terracidiphilus sp.]|nr:hypothetical protein [Terracidiphilus sp.]